MSFENRVWYRLGVPGGFGLGRFLQMKGPALPMLDAYPLGGGLCELRERMGHVRSRVVSGFDDGRMVVLLPDTL